MKTYEYFRKLHITETIDLDQIALEYQKTQTNELLISAFDQVFSMCFLLANKYKVIDDADAESISLYELHKALMNFDPSNGTKFITLFHTYLDNEFTITARAANMQMRKANIFTESLNREDRSEESELDYNINLLTLFEG